MVRSTLPCTILRGFELLVSSRASGGRGRNTEDDFDLAVINLNAADHQPDDVTSGRPVEQVEVLTDPDREVLQAPDHQGQVALGCAGRASASRCSSNWAIRALRSATRG